ncbi:hypothetical protein FOCC_FOCC004672 [Frankliniella occidentalis]|nr:hypothetical protein FOCC_FOCC004672 [Frankliniella occidentalis]
MLQMNDGRWCNIGIVSFGVRCGEPGKPGVYTNVGKYLDWIAQNTRSVPAVPEERCDERPICVKSVITALWSKSVCSH